MINKQPHAHAIITQHITASARCASTTVSTVDHQHVRSVALGYLFGLCEGNFCKGGPEGRERGNGRLVVFTYRELPHNASVGSKHHTCQYVGAGTVARL